MLDAAVLNRYPQADCRAIQALLKEKCREDGHKIVVLDDDPTGVQTVHDVSVYTDWSYESIKKGFEEDNKLFYILTNSRGFTVEQTTRAHLEIGENVARVSEETGIDYVIVSRGDSTLRGHYPLETELLAQAEETYRGKPVDGEIICPYLKRAAVSPLTMYIMSNMENSWFRQERLNLQGTGPLDIIHRI